MYASAMTQAMYNAYFGVSTASKLWINGNAESAPLSQEPLQDANVHVKSQNWMGVLTAGKVYQLRQRIFKGAGTNKWAIFDVAYNFTYYGFTAQDQTTVAANRALSLTNRLVLLDTTGISWNTPVETVLFWLPFSSAVTGNVYTACGSYALESTGCGMTTASIRRYGSAGIIGSAQDFNDPALSWAPHLNSDAGNDIAYCHQNTGVYGMSGDGMWLSYWVR